MTETELRQMLNGIATGNVTRRQMLDRMLMLGVPSTVALAAIGAGPAQAQLAVPAYKPTRRGGGGTLKMLFWQGATLLNPHFANGSKDAEGCSPFNEPLVRADVNGQWVPVLVAEMPSRANGGLSADGRTVVWKLKKDVQWHDGKPFTADDVVFNWQYAVDPAAAAYTSGLYEGVKAVEKIDTHTVRVVFERPTPDWTLCASVKQVPKHVFSAYMGTKSRDAPANLKPVGTGPYRIVDFRPGDLIIGELNPNYHQPNRPYFDRIEIKGGGDATSAARAVIQAGEYDFAWSLQVEDEVLKRMESGGKGRVVIVPGGSTEYIQLNAADPWTETEGERAHPKSRHPVLSDLAVRQAMMLLLDRAGIQEFVYGRSGVASPNILNNPPLYNSKGVPAEFNVDKAVALLDAAGWKPGPDGVRAKGGRKLKLVFQTSTNSVRQKVQAIYKQACAKAGIELEIKAISATVFFSSDVGNPDTIGKFWADLQMYQFTRGPDPARYMQNYVSWEMASKANKWLKLNRGRWSNAEFDRLFKAAETELDPVKRAAMFIQMNDIVCKDGQVIPVAYRPGLHATANRLVAPVTAWDNVLSALSDWYREA